jgi:hypothetical protein
LLSFGWGAQPCQGKITCGFSYLPKVTAGFFGLKNDDLGENMTISKGGVGQDAGARV